MTQDVAGFGLKINLIASITYPTGIQITQFDNELDALDIDELEEGILEMGLNGEGIAYSRPNPIFLTLGVIPQSQDDVNLGILFDINRVGIGKLSVQDLIIMTVSYPLGRTVTYTGGKTLSYLPGYAVATSGRMKAKPYRFGFEGKIGGF